MTLALSILAALFLALRSLTVRSLRPAAVACCAFVGLDALRLALDGWPDVVVVVAMPACWGALLVGTSEGSPRRRPPKPVGACAHAPILPRLFSLALCLLFSSLLLLSRHHPAVAAHWQGAMQLPRLVVGGVALWVALKSRGPRANPEPHAANPRQLFDGTGSGSATYPGSHLSAVPLPRRPGFGTADRARGILAPSQLIGIILALGSAACVVGGLWAGDWGGVRAVSLVSWGLVVGVAWRARD